MVANLSSLERQHPCSQSPAPPAPLRPQPRAAPSPPRPPGLAGLAAHHPRARPELRRLGARSCLWRHRQIEASTLERGPGPCCDEPWRRRPQAQPDAPARPWGRPKPESPSGPRNYRRLHSNRARSSPSARPTRLPPTAPGSQPLPQRPALPSTRRLPPPPQPTPSPPRRQPRPSFRPPAARPRYREYGGGRGESRLGPKRANRSPPQVPPPPPAASHAPLLPPYAGTRLPARGPPPLVKSADCPPGVPGSCREFPVL